MAFNARRLALASVVAAACGVAGPMQAQVISQETFDFVNTPWTANGVETIVDDGRGINGPYLQLPFMDFFGISLRNEDARSGLLGDLSRYPNGLKLSFDMRTFQFLNFNGEEIDPSSRPLVIHLFDDGDPENFEDNAGVWFIGPHIPGMADGWQHFEYSVPTPMSTALPPGWQGSGAEDPVTFEPTLPPGRTYANVLASVDRVEVTTFVPGFFYGSSFTEVGFDNILVEPIVPPCPCDFNGGGLSVQDIFDFLGAYFANDPRADLNSDGISVQDIFDFLACYFAGC